MAPLLIYVCRLSQIAAGDFYHAADGQCRLQPNLGHGHVYISETVQREVVPAVCCHVGVPPETLSDGTGAVCRVPLMLKMPSPLDVSDVPRRSLNASVADRNGDGLPLAY